MSTAKEIIFEEEARQKLANGIKKLAEIVAFTLGPKGRNVGIEKSWGAPSITNDGASIVKDISLEDVYENMGVSMAKEVVQKIKEAIRDTTPRRNGHSMTAIIQRLNRKLRGWFNYFRSGTRKPFTLLDDMVRRRLRAIMVKRQKKRGRGRGWAHAHERWIHPNDRPPQKAGHRPQ